MRGLGFAPLYGCIAYAFTVVEFVVILLDKVCKTMLIGRKRSGFLFFFFFCCICDFLHLKNGVCGCRFVILFVALLNAGLEMMFVNKNGIKE